MINQESLEQLYQSLQKLHKDYRDALLLVYFEELSYKETAFILGKSEKQITNLVYRGKKALKEIMEKEEH